MKEALLAIGLSEKESEIYLALASIGRSSIADLLKRTSIERRTIYDVLERLVQKGWASFFEENGRRYYVSANPQVILEDLNERKDNFEKVIPKLNKLREKISETRVEVYKGVRGLKTIFSDIVSSNEIHYAFGNVEPFISQDPYYKVANSFLEKLEARDIKEKVIYPIGNPVRKIKSGQYKAVDRSLIPPTTTIVYGDVTLQFVFSNPLTIIKITSKEVADTNRRYFDYFWKMK